MTEKPTTRTTATAPARGADRPIRLRDAFDLLDDFPQEMMRIWGQTWPLFSRPIMRPLSRLGELSTTWAPRVDVYEQNGQLVVKAELPGVNKEDVTISLDDGDLVISGERKTEKEVREDDYYRVERAYGRFHRRLPLPVQPKAEDVKASFDDGVLEIRIAKPPETKPEPKKIAIS